jgi:hypothetical protein
LENTENIEQEPQEVKPKRNKGLAGILGKLDSVSESGLQKVLFNMPFVLFLVLIAVLHIANNHLADNYARRISKTEKDVKQLRWQYMTSASALMRLSKESEVAKLVGTQGLKELRIPPYKIEVSSLHTGVDDGVSKN